MIISQTLRSTDRSDRLPVFGVLAFLWILAAVLVLALIGIAFVPGHMSDGLHQLNDLLPADPSLWTGFTA